MSDTNKLLSGCWRNNDILKEILSPFQYGCLRKKTTPEKYKGIIEEFRGNIYRALMENRIKEPELKTWLASHLHITEREIVIDSDERPDLDEYIIQSLELKPTIPTEINLENSKEIIHEANKAVKSMLNIQTQKKADKEPLIKSCKLSNSQVRKIGKLKDEIKEAEANKDAKAVMKAVIQLEALFKSLPGAMEYPDNLGKLINGLTSYIKTVKASNVEIDEESQQAREKILEYGLIYLEKKEDLPILYLTMLSASQLKKHEIAIDLADKFLESDGFNKNIALETATRSAYHLNKMELAYHYGLKRLLTNASNIKHVLIELKIVVMAAASLGWWPKAKQYAELYLKVEKNPLIKNVLITSKRRIDADENEISARHNYKQAVTTKVITNSSSKL